MEKIAIALALVALMAGCVSMSYDANSGSFAYNRFGNQEINGLVIHKDLSSLDMELGSAKSEREIGEVIMKLSNTLDKAIKLLQSLSNKIPGVDNIMDVPQ